MKVKDRVDSQVNNFINVIKSKQTQDKLTLNVKIRANVGNLFDSILFSGANKVNNETGKKRKRMVSFFIARKATSTDTKVYDNKVTKIVKGEKGVAAEKTATTDGTTTVLNKEESGFKKVTKGGSTEIKQRSSKRMGNNAIL